MTPPVMPAMTHGQIARARCQAPITAERQMRQTKRAVMVNARIVAALALGCVLLAAREHTGWSSPEILTGFPARRLTRMPGAVVNGDTVIVAADAVPFHLADTLDTRGAVIVRRPGGAIPLPAGQFQFVRPKLAVDAHRRVHLFWGELGTPATRLQQLGRDPSTLWHAVLSPAGWSAPELVLRAKKIGWEDAQGAISADSGGALHLVVPASESGVPRLTYLRLSGGHWTRHDLRPAAASASIVAASPRSLFIAFIGGDTTRAEDHSVLFVLRSRDGGESWLPAELIQRPESLDAATPRLLVDGRTVDVAWVTRVRNGFDLEEMRLARFDSVARHWTSLASIPMPDGALVFDVARHPCGEIAAIIQTLNDNPRRIGLEEISLYHGTVRRSVPSLGLVGARDATIFDRGDGFGLAFSGFLGTDPTMHTAIVTRRGCVH